MALEIILVITYLWAGVTVCFSLWLFETIAEALNHIHPDEFKYKNNLRGRPSAFAIIVVGWPFVLPVWAWASWKERSGSTSATGAL